MSNNGQMAKQIILYQFGSFWTLKNPGYVNLSLLVEEAKSQTMIHYDYNYILNSNACNRKSGKIQKENKIDLSG